MVPIVVVEEEEEEEEIEGLNGKNKGRAVDEQQDLDQSTLTARWILGSSLC